MKTKWRKHIPSFNIAKGLIEENFAYLAAIGFAAKINLDNGNYTWKHEGFYRKYKESGAFNVFLTPQLKDNLVIFKEDDISSRGFDHQLHVDKSSGKIIKVILD
ncbi:MAG: hypothetical protein M3405_03790 [Acidobacteriota bacterium]|nr:hypothetical protein [Acidobacteriota bacterium]